MHQQVFQYTPKVARPSLHGTPPMHPGPEVTGRNYFYRRFRKVLKAVGLGGSDSHYDIYAFKHSRVINMYQSLKDITLVQKQCRHQFMNQTMEYLRDLDVFRNGKEYDEVQGF